MSHWLNCETVGCGLGEGVFLLLIQNAVCTFVEIGSMLTHKTT